VIKIAGMQKVKHGKIGEHTMLYSHFFVVLRDGLEAIIAGGGYMILFLTTFFEGLPLIGVIIPGHVAIIVGGFMAHIGILDLRWVLAISVVGAVLGDYMGYFLGKKYGLSLITTLRKFFFARDSHIEKAQGLLAKHTGKAMILGRFSPVTRALMPFLVGAGNTGSRKFWFYNIIGAISWVTLSVMAGYIFGSGYQVALGYMGKLVLWALILMALIIWGYRFINIRYHIFAKYELFALTLNLLSLWILAKTIQDTWTTPSFMANFDVWVNLLVTHLAEEGNFLLINIASWISMLGGTKVIGSLGLLIGFLFLLQRRWRSAAIMLFSIGAVTLVVTLMKDFFLRARPYDVVVVVLEDPSFPSGHATMSAAFFVIFAYLLSRRVNSLVKRELLIVGCVLAMIVIGLSRILLNVHWASDVIAGWALGIFIATGSILLVRYVSALVLSRYRY